MTGAQQPAARTQVPRTTKKVAAGARTNAQAVVSTAANEVSTTVATGVGVLDWMVALLNAVERTPMAIAPWVVSKASAGRVSGNASAN
ncbi:hypothetical protein ACTWQF_29140 [Streptomyces sp. 8N114]|uniref:hypothetical protein n=1 Tax=Streptomyces sp. 8N114 TaxID=3457419 RepID=UPI003FD674A7